MSHLFRLLRRSYGLRLIQQDTRRSYRLFSSSPFFPHASGRQNAAARFPLSQVTADRQSVDVLWQDEARSSFHHFWLRDNCHCSDCMEPSSRQKLHTCADIDLDVGVHSVLVDTAVASAASSRSTGESSSGSSVTIEWSDGHVSNFSADWLRLNRYDDQALEALDQARRPRLWTGEWVSRQQLPEIDFEEVIQTDRGLFTWLYHLQEKGVCVINNAPTETGHVDQLAERAGNLRRTIYGDRTWFVRVEADPVNIAYTTVGIPSHMDLLYYECAPGIQLLHFVRTSAAGGANFFVDAFAAAERLSKESPEAFQLLSETHLPYHMQDGQNWLYNSRPVIETDRRGRVLAVSFAPPFEAPLRLPFNRMRAVYSAYSKLNALLSSPSLTVRKRFNAGQIVTFNNRRVMHGRESIRLSEAEKMNDKVSSETSEAPDRLVEGCYIDLDEAASRFRSLKRDFGHPSDQFQGLSDRFSAFRNPK